MYLSAHHVLDKPQTFAACILMVPSGGLKITSLLVGELYWNSFQRERERAKVVLLNWKASSGNRSLAAVTADAT